MKRDTQYLVGAAAVGAALYMLRNTGKVAPDTQAAAEKAARVAMQKERILRETNDIVSGVRDAYTETKE